MNLTRRTFLQWLPGCCVWPLGPRDPGFHPIPAARYDWFEAEFPAAVDRWLAARLFEVENRTRADGGDWREALVAQQDWCTWLIYRLRTWQLLLRP